MQRSREQGRIVGGVSRRRYLILHRSRLFVCEDKRIGGEQQSAREQGRIVGGVSRRRYPILHRSRLFLCKYKRLGGEQQSAGERRDREKGRGGENEIVNRSINQPIS
ncbi:MAG: hypothetical protein J7J76_09085 [Candidatus Latescibacteria bacterium]|nr:hypothetical protein [Candidatus Latescibacterota bacterium]